MRKDGLSSGANNIIFNHESLLISSGEYKIKRCCSLSQSYRGTVHGRSVFRSLGLRVFASAWPPRQPLSSYDFASFGCNTTYYIWKRSAVIIDHRSIAYRSSMLLWGTCLQKWTIVKPVS